MKIHRLNTSGVIHWTMIAPIAVIVLVAAVGIRTFKASHAETPSSAVVATASPDLLFIGGDRNLFTSSAAGPSKQFKPIINFSDFGNEQTPVVYALNGSTIYYANGPDALQLDSISSNGQNSQVIFPSALTPGYTYTSLAWSEKAQKLAIVETDDTADSSIVTTINPNGSDPTQLYSGKPVGSPVWSPDGTKLAFPAAINDIFNTVVVENSDGSNQVILNPTCQQLDDVYDLSWTADSNSLICASAFGNVYQVSDTNSAPQTILSDQSIPSGTAIASALLSPDGTKLLYTLVPAAKGVTPSCSVNVLTLSTNETQNIARYSYRFCGNNIAWSPDSNKIAFDTNYKVSTTNIYNPISPGQLFVAKSDGTNLHVIHTLGKNDYIFWTLVWGVQ